MTMNSFMKARTAPSDAHARNPDVPTAE